MSDADNIVYGPLNNLRAIIAASSNFQTLVGEATAAAALNHIYSPMLHDGIIKTARPFALVDFGEKADMIRRSSDNFKFSGSLLVQFDVGFPSDATLGLSSPTETARADAGHKWFAKLVGDILSDMLDLTDGGGGYLRIDAIRQRFAAMRSHTEDQNDWGDFYVAVYEIEYS